MVNTSAYLSHVEKERTKSIAACVATAISVVVVIIKNLVDEVFLIKIINVI
jgi:hypothetical protein